MKIFLQIFGCLTYQQFAHGCYNSTHCHPVSSVRAVVIISPSTQTIFKHCFISDDDDLCQPVAGYEVEYCLQRITKKNHRNVKVRVSNEAVKNLI